MAGARSPFTLERPPPARPPHGVAAVIGWELAAYLWRAHVPDPLLGGDRCARCGLVMPCLCWRFADAFLADLLHPLTEAAEERTRELPQVRRPPLPRRQLGAQLGADTNERYQGWFTP